MAEHVHQADYPEGRDPLAGPHVESVFKPARPATSGKVLPHPSTTKRWEAPAEPFEGGAGSVPGDKRGNAGRFP
jgi:hypothetical protein